MGLALVPKKQIYRRNEKTNEEYYIYFSKETIRKASQLFLKNSNQNNATLEHQTKIEGMSICESWIVEDEKKDKSALYNFKKLLLVPTILKFWKLSPNDIGTALFMAGCLIISFVF